MLKLRVFNTGWIAVQEKHLYAGGSSATRLLPVLAFVIEHPRGLIVFDAGLNAAFASNPGRHVGWLNDKVAPFRSSTGMNLSARMRTEGVAPEDVQYVVLSHLHYDHTGDLRAFPRAKFLLARQEWQAAQSPMRRVRGYLSKEYTGLDLQLLDLPLRNGLTVNGVMTSGYGLDLMGDGTLIIVPTFGHTFGHLSMIAFLLHGTVLLAGDAVYVREGYVRPAAQPHAHCADLAWRSLIGLRSLTKGDPNALILPAHDDTITQSLERPDILIGKMGAPG